ncbi:tetratricopeptide repeat protein [Micromonospora sp. BL4]|uniref:tetratricopeptide repeat protein n=1 Tax=Micromonospora sp. BL4 TaxID=2478710 RepID=UPI000EF5FABF|nr:tetratricopeptide repeat protein [Micromonospora sp. BL4]
MRLRCCAASLNRPRRLFRGTTPARSGCDSSSPVRCRRASQDRRALRLFERVVQDRERILGADHTASLNARRNRGMASAVRGQRRRARSVLTDVLADYIRMLGEAHPYTASGRSSLERLPSLHEFPP